jgi:GNAT superfamily N-acetyltransferase
VAPSPPALQIRPASEDDVPLILSFIRELAEYEQLAHEVSASEADVWTHLFGADRIAYAEIACVDGEPAGFALYFYSFSTFVGRPGLYLEDLYVRPAWRRRGIGRALLAHLAGLAVERGCGRMEWSVLDWNELALRLYRGIGARPMGDWTVQRLTGDALKALAASAPRARPSSDP